MKSLLWLLAVAALLPFTDQHIDPVGCQLKCKQGQRCFRWGKRLTCERFFPTCDLKCPAGHSCQLLQTICLRAPCFPLQTCVPKSHSACGQVRCPSGQVCVARPAKPAECQTPY